MGEPNYIKTIERIIALLKADVKFAPKIKDFRFGELPEKSIAKAYPACYVTTSIKPEISREPFGPARRGKRPNQKIKTEYWIVLVTQKATSALTQKVLYELRLDVMNILEGNTQLRLKRSIADPSSVTPMNGNDLIDPQCQNLEASTIGRFTEQRGQIMDGLTVIVKCINFKNAST